MEDIKNKKQNGEESLPTGETEAPETSEIENQDKELSIEEKLATAEADLEACNERVLRLAAELENFKKRMQREKEEHMKYALESFARELLPFLDNLERAVESAREVRDIEKLIEGLDLTLSGYFKTLKQFGLEVFAAEGKRFDPAYHEALTTETSHELEDNTVIKELLKGYKLHERVLRPAMVVVSKKDS